MPFEYLAHVVTIPVTVGGIEARFIFDTGIGVNLISEDLAAKVGCHREFVRYFTELRGDIQVSGAPSIRVTDPQVMFQKIIYDGLVGDRFLRNFTTTYDLRSSQVNFAIPG